MEPGEHTELSLDIFDGEAYAYALGCAMKGERYDMEHLRALRRTQAELLAMNAHDYANYREAQRRLFRGQSIPEMMEQAEAQALAAPSQTERARLLYEAENKANEFVMAGDALVEAVLYKLLYARGLRIASIDTEIRKALDQRLGMR